MISDRSESNRPVDKVSSSNCACLFKRSLCEFGHVSVALGNFAVRKIGKQICTIADQLTVTVDEYSF
jgi:hypothetical protein